MNKMADSIGTAPHSSAALFTREKCYLFGSAPLAGQQSAGFTCSPLSPTRFLQGKTDNTQFLNFFIGAGQMFCSLGPNNHLPILHIIHSTPHHHRYHHYHHLTATTTTATTTSPLPPPPLRIKGSLYPKS